MFSKLFSFTLFILLLFATFRTEAASTVWFDQEFTLTNDTLTASTKDTLVDYFVPRANYDYELHVRAFTSAGGDSVNSVIEIEALGPDSTRLTSYICVDTVNDSAGTQVLLPVNDSIVGNYYRIILKAITGQGGVILPNSSVPMYRRKTYTFETK